MTSLNTRARKIRRFGVLARIEIVDVDNDEEFEKNRSTEDQYDHLSTPTAVTFSIVGNRRCEILGPPKAMKHRIGRWRRVYDPQGEESRLGWGEESFVDSYKIDSRDVSLVLPVRTITVSSNTGSPRKHEIYRFLYFIPAPL